MNPSEPRFEIPLREMFPSSEICEKLKIIITTQGTNMSHPMISEHHNLKRCGLRAL